MTDTDRRPDDEPDRAPRPNRILTERATIARCAEDYAAGTPVRTTAAKQWTTDRRR
ncbi:hypothetical protein [Streptomyces noursei]|uniref:hypothetical protein n=1 Tax=Streptomyces noursei TaxID=1971 RepID=UPI0023B79A10|nr:hypothetical protein [Streptomyces noursei]